MTRRPGERNQAEVFTCRVSHRQMLETAKRLFETHSQWGANQALTRVRSIRAKSRTDQGRSPTEQPLTKRQWERDLNLDTLNCVGQQVHHAGLVLVRT
jgi:hypothetical protein